MVGRRHAFLPRVGFVYRRSASGLLASKDRIGPSRKAGDGDRIYWQGSELGAPSGRAAWHTRSSPLVLGVHRARKAETVRPIATYCQAAIETSFPQPAGRKRLDSSLNFDLFGVPYRCCGRKSLVLAMHQLDQTTDLVAPRAAPQWISRSAVGWRMCSR
jgi:hypothetical protein